jgi:hypothetical protein
MGAAEEQRTEVLVLRAWVEDAGEKGLRVRITRMRRSLEGATSDVETSASATVDGVCEAVRDWLEELMDGLPPLSPSDERECGQADQ